MPPNLTLTLDHDALTATITTPTGDTIARRLLPVRHPHPEPDYLEHRPDDWWRACTEAIATLPPDARAAVTNITLAGDLRAILFLDTDREPIRNAILIDDPRAAAGAPSILQWLRANQTIAYKRVRHVTTPRGYLRFLLTNTLALTPEDAAITALLDDTGQHWSAARCDAHEINEEILPPLLTAVKT